MTPTCPLIYRTDMKGQLILGDKKQSQSLMIDGINIEDGVVLLAWASIARK